MGGRHCAINSPLGSRWGQKSLDIPSPDFCPHHEPRGELITQYRSSMSFRYKLQWCWHTLSIPLRSWFWSEYSIYHHIHTMYYTCNCILDNRNKLFLWAIYMLRDGVAMTVCWMLWYSYSFLPGFKCIFQLYSSRFYISWYGYRYHVTLCIGQLHPITVYKTVFVCALFWCWVSSCIPFTNSLIEFYFIKIIGTVIGIFMAIIFILNLTLRLSMTK